MSLADLRLDRRQRSERIRVVGHLVSAEQDVRAGARSVERTGLAHEGRPSVVIHGPERLVAADRVDGAVESRLLGRCVVQLGLRHEDLVAVDLLAARTALVAVPVLGVGVATVGQLLDRLDVPAFRGLVERQIDQILLVDAPHVPVEAAIVPALRLRVHEEPARGDTLAGGPPGVPLLARRVGSGRHTVLVEVVRAHQAHAKPEQHVGRDLGQHRAEPEVARPAVQTVPHGDGDVALSPRPASLHLHARVVVHQPGNHQRDVLVVGVLRAVLVGVVAAPVVERPVVARDLLLVALKMLISERNGCVDLSHEVAGVGVKHQR